LLLSFDEFPILRIDCSQFVDVQVVADYVLSTPVHLIAWQNAIPRGATDDGSDPIELRILSVNQMGDVANVLIAFGDEWVDFHNLSKIDGVWKITYKTATHSSRVSPSWQSPVKK
jgi:hypothetical protein